MLPSVIGFLDPNEVLAQNITFIQTQFELIENQLLSLSIQFQAKD